MVNVIKEGNFMKQKLSLLVICGGQSAEHEVSVISTRNVVAALDTAKYDIQVAYINKSGVWYLFESPKRFLTAEEPAALLGTSCAPKANLPLTGVGADTELTTKTNNYKIDVVFPVMHGMHSEDGTLQGFLELANVPYVGPGVLGSAVCMDKEVSKKLLRAEQIATARWLTAYRHEIDQLNFDKIISELGLPLFVKPANTGSSVGISKVKSRDDFSPAIELALQYDHKILFEEFIAAREIECSVLGNEHPEASIPGEIIPHHEFYTYEAKYFDPNGASLAIPAELPEKIIQQIQTIAKKAFIALSCEGMARVDFFVTNDYKIYVNEINTIPGFTSTSMYPKLWEASGLSYEKLLDKLIQLAIERFNRNQLLATKNHFKKNIEAA